MTFQTFTPTTTGRAVKAQTEVLTIATIFYGLSYNLDFFCQTHSIVFDKDNSSATFSGALAVIHFLFPANIFAYCTV